MLFRIVIRARIFLARAHLDIVPSKKYTECHVGFFTEFFYHMKYKTSFFIRKQKKKQVIKKV